MWVPSVVVRAGRPGHR
ncbi:hypothetical protein E2C01_075588 [Portunus trituberculatus]|uniref:Uncharacterized protein n=1 Tax=Portunus trituberculatus TaxID=210409 RepID=A0A5B7IJI7_PORTR|nr:hypothetical protein [Portunus trituberculatus]